MRNNLLHILVAIAVVFSTIPNTAFAYLHGAYDAHDVRESREFVLGSASGRTSTQDPAHCKNHASRGAMTHAQQAIQATHMAHAAHAVQSPHLPSGRHDCESCRCLFDCAETQAMQDTEFGTCTVPHDSAYMQAWDSDPDSVAPHPLTHPPKV